MYRYEFTPVALRQLEKLSPQIQKRILKKLDFYCRQQDPIRFSDFLTDERLGQFRYRIGSYRVVFDLEENVLVILSVGHRKDIYRKH